MWNNNINLIAWIWWEINIDFIKKLLLLWVKEFFIWFVPNYWIEKYWFDISPNRRYSSDFQIKTFKDFIFLSKLLRKFWAKVYFTLNDHNYSKDSFKFIERLIDDTNEYVDGYIIANFALLELLQGKWREIHISWDICTLNNFALDFFVENNVSRVILPRNITLLEIEKIAEYRNKNHSNLELELFINDSLLYTCWLCTSFHWEENYIFCRDKKANTRTLIDYNNKKKVDIKIDVDTEIIAMNCSLCFMWKFIDLWIDSYKIPWRTGELWSVIKRIVELKKYLSDKPVYNWKVILEEYNWCNFKNCMYEL
jgi:hypothetical protein